MPQAETKKAVSTNKLIYIVVHQLAQGTTERAQNDPNGITTKN